LAVNVTNTGTGGFLNGPYGKFVLGAKLEYLKRTSFGGIGGVVSTDNTVAFISLRYYF
jgi:hypothetical protein